MPLSCIRKGHIAHIAATVAMIFAGVKKNKPYILGLSLTIYTILHIRCSRGAHRTRLHISGEEKRRENTAKAALTIQQPPLRINSSLDSSCSL
jgi:hypothetical protein